MVAHDRLHLVVIRLPTDYEPYGSTPRGPLDCSHGCKHFAPLAGNVGHDWGVCTNPEGHRRGLLTFEHQGCEQFEQGARKITGLEEQL